MNKEDIAKRKKQVAYGLLVIAVLYMISGFGITSWQIVQPLTLGLLTKSLAFKIHDWLLLPFILLIISHVFLAIKARR